MSYGRQADHAMLTHVVGLLGSPCALVSNVQRYHGHTATCDLTSASIGHAVIAALILKKEVGVHACHVFHPTHPVWNDAFAMQMLFMGHGR